MEGENDPDWQLLKYKAREVYEKGEYDKAEELLTDAIKYMPEAEPGPAASLLGFRGTVYTKMNKLDLAIKDANAGLKICSSSFSCLRCRGMANYLLERWVDAREDLMAAELIMPDESRMIPNLVKEIGAKIAKVKAETFPHFEDRRNRFLEEARNKILTWRESLGSREPLEPPLDVYIDWRDAPVLTPIRMQGFGKDFFSHYAYTFLSSGFMDCYSPT
ncbi:hypothetical protein FRX31_022314 [Thalictrum thalictroides]|uniref:Uncharacterized protein n=1 Tax=Thalictrum thalictroides TaxID=46969 RepID=A0A7J6VSN5_THATH|nr:hypothetical protein FRX31_022314 [Thalictrum thalictroides]